MLKYCIYSLFPQPSNDPPPLFFCFFVKARSIHFIFLTNACSDSIYTKLPHCLVGLFMGKIPWDYGCARDEELYVSAAFCEYMKVVSIKATSTETQTLTTDKKELTSDWAIISGMCSAKTSQQWEFSNRVKRTHFSKVKKLSPNPEGSAILKEADNSTRY